MNLLNSIKYMNLFLDLGWNAVIYDHRRHGASGGKTTSYGYYEKNDLKTVVNWLREKHGEQALIGIHGESMGAVTTLLYAGMDDAEADFYVADCPFATFEDQLIYRLKEDFHLPGAFILPLASLFLRWRDGYRIRDVSPLSVVGKIKNRCCSFTASTTTISRLNQAKCFTRKNRGRNGFILLKEERTQ